MPKGFDRCKHTNSNSYNCVYSSKRTQGPGPYTHICTYTGTDNNSLHSYNCSPLNIDTKIDTSIKMIPGRSAFSLPSNNHPNNYGNHASMVNVDNLGTDKHIDKSILKTTFIPRNILGNSIIPHGSALPGISAFNALTKKIGSPTHGKLLINEKVINISNGGLQDSHIGVLVQGLQYQALNLAKFDASNNQLGYYSVENLFYTFRIHAPAATYNINYIDLSNNLIDNNGAKYIASHLKFGWHPNLREINLSGNNKIDGTGYGYFAEALQSEKVKDIIIHLKLLSGPFIDKKDYIASLKYMLEKAKAAGIDTDNIVIDKNILTRIWDVAKLSCNTVYSFSKCYFIPDDPSEFVADQIVAKAPRYIKGIMNKLGVFSCYLDANRESYTSELGVKVIKTELEVMGASEFFDALEQ